LFLISNNRVWGYNQNDTTILKDNIAYKSTNLPSSNDLIQSTELRPAISFSSIIDLMIKKVRFTNYLPFIFTKEYKDLYVWCTNENIYSTKQTKLTIKTPFGLLFFLRF
jgi:hypothetical protein